MKTKNRVKNQEAVSFLFKKMWKFAKGHRHMVVFVLITSFFANMLTLVEPLIFKQFVNEVSDNGVSESNFWTLVLILFGYLALELAMYAFHGPSRVVERNAAFMTERNYKNYLLKGILNLNLSWHTQRDSGDTIDRVDRATSALKGFSDWSGNFIINATVIKMIVTAAILFSFDMYMGILSLAIVLASLAIIYRFDLKLIPQYKRLNEFGNRVSAKIYDAISNVTTVKILDIEKPILKEISTTIMAPFKLVVENSKLIELKWFTGSILFKFVKILPVIVFIYMIVRNNSSVDIGTLTAITIYVGNLVEVFWGFSSTYQDMVIKKARVQNVEDIENDIEKMLKIKKRAIPKWENLKLENVIFKYEDSDKKRNDINNVNIEIRNGERIALIGKSGSGKSTILKVIHGMYSNAKGKILINNKTDMKLEETDIPTILVPQEPEIFSSTIRSNITMGVNFDESEIEKVMELAQFSEVVKTLPKGLDSVVNEKGVNLSGGQKQRLALARAMIFASDNKDILLLDESTSSVDPNTENKIYENIFKYFSGKTVIASIHKMNLLKYFDRIIIFERGKVKDDGTFEEILKRNYSFRVEWEKYISEDRKK